MPNLSYISPKAEVRESPIHGRGLFAREPFAAGEVVCVKGGYVFDRAALRAMPGWYGSAEIQLTEDLFIGPLAEDEREGSMVFSNHSCEPNIGVRGQIVFVALRAVAAGEELTHDWATTDDDDYELECNCGAHACRRRVTGQDWRREDLRRKYRGFFSSHLEEKIRRAGDEPEAGKGLNAVTVAYYFGAMLMISACAWFLGDKWESLGSRGVFVTVLAYVSAALGVGLLLRRRGFVVGGGFLVTVAVCLVPLLVYTVEDMLGLWPGQRPGEYGEYYPRVHGSWIAMELATMLAALVALRFVAFGFLTAPLAYSFWFFSMDVAEWIYGDSLSRNQRCWVSVAVGLLTMLVGYGLERSYRRPDVPRTEDFAFWCYLFGLLAFWCGFTFMDSGSELGRLLYALLNVGLMAVGVYLRRSVFLVFGVLGVHIYLGHLAYEVFKDSVLFPFALALLGLSVILVTVLAQRQLIKRLRQRDRDERDAFAQ